MSTPLFAASLSTQQRYPEAFAEVVASLRDALGGERPDLVVAFVSHHHGSSIEGLGPALARELSARCVIGCTGEAVVGGAREIERGAALSVWAAVLPGTSVRRFATQAREEGENVYAFEGVPEVIDRERASAVMLAEPFSFPVGDYLAVFDRESPGVPLIGGMASGGNGPGQNLLFTEEGLVDGGAIGVVVEGDVEVVPVVSQGCRPIGKPFVITACRENFVQKLGGKPALQALLELLNELPPADKSLVQRGPMLGLAVDPKKSTFERADFLVRGIVGFEKNLGAIAVADGSIRNGMTVQFLVRDAASASEDLDHVVRALPGRERASGALLFSCNGRGTRLFGKPDHDAACIQGAWGSELPVAGFFANGEMGPVGGRNSVHGFTASLALFRERARS